MTPQDIDRSIDTNLAQKPTAQDRAVIHAAVARGVTVRDAAVALGLAVVAVYDGASSWDDGSVWGAP